MHLNDTRVVDHFTRRGGEEIAVLFLGFEYWDHISQDLFYTFASVLCIPRV